MRFTKMGILAAAVVSLCGFASQTRANSIDPLSNLNESIVGSNVTYKIDMKVTGGSEIVSGNEFSLFGITGLDTTLADYAGLEPAGWTIQFNTASAAEYPAINPALIITPNITFIWGGGTVGNATTDVDLGTFTIKGSTPALAVGATIFGASTYLNIIGSGPATAPGNNSFQTSVVVPLPEASMMGFVSLAGLAGMAAMRKRLRSA